MDPARRRELTRYAAPAAFLAAATIAVLLIKAGLDNGDAQPVTTPITATTAPTTTQQTTTKLVLTGTTTSTAPDAEYYVIKSGDTLGGIASQYDTTVEALLALNPDVDPTALHPGDRIRVG